MVPFAKKVVSQENVKNALEKLYSADQRLDGLRELVNLYNASPEDFARIWKEIRPRKESRRKEMLYLKNLLSPDTIKELSVSEEKMEEMLKLSKVFFEEMEKIEETILRKDVEMVYNILTQKRIRRTWPTGQSEIKAKIRRAVEEERPVHLVGFWGGYKESTTGLSDKADDRALSLLLETSEEIQKLGMDCKITIIFADFHALKINGKPKDRVEEYYEGISFECYRRGIELVRLSDLYERWRGEPDYMATLALARQEIKKRWNENPELVERFKGMARRHSDRVKDGEDPEDVAQDYLIIRFREARMLAVEFPDALFFSYGNPELEKMFNDLPTLYFYSIEEGTCECPWFLEM